MNVTISKCKSIKEKKKQIIYPNQDNYNYKTPIKSTLTDTPIKPYNHIYRSDALSRTQSMHADPTDKKQCKDLPQNALMKKCFQKNREIKNIKDLSIMYQSKVLSKSKYRFHPQDSLNKSSRSNKQQSYNNKKNYYDKIAKNILATEQSIVYNSGRSRSRSKKSLTFSQSKIIKQAIIHYVQ